MSKQPARPHSTAAERAEQQRQDAVGLVVRLLLEAHAATSSKVAWLSEELEPPRELTATVTLLLAEIETRMKRPVLRRKAQRGNMERIADLSRQLAAALHNPDVASDLHGPDGLLASAIGVRIEDIEQIAHRADRIAARIPDGPGNTTMDAVTARAPAAWVCVASGAWLFERATGRGRRAANRAVLLDILDLLWIGAGGPQPSSSFWDRPIAAVLGPDSQKAAGKEPALLDARLIVRDAARLGGLLRFEGARPQRLEAPGHNR
jgi:hypothetical protein